MPTASRTFATSSMFSVPMADRAKPVRIIRKLIGVHTCDNATVITRMEEQQLLKPIDNVDLFQLKLGQIWVDKEVFELDLKINEGYQAYSAELLRLALLIMAGLSAVWLKLYLPDNSYPNPAVGSHSNSLPLWNRVSFACSFALIAIAAGAALLHRYVAADSLAYHLTALRRRSRNCLAKSHRPSDTQLADQQEKQRDRRFK